MSVSDFCDMFGFDVKDLEQLSFWQKWRGIYVPVYHERAIIGVEVELEFGPCPVGSIEIEDE